MVAARNAIRDLLALEVDVATLLASGATAIGGRIPVNPSGGLSSRGHPVGAVMGVAQDADDLTARVDHKARICVRQCHYSVPARLAGWTVNVRLGATFVEVRSGGRVVASHERAGTRGAQSLVLDHYLEVLVRKPGALPNATALAQAFWPGPLTLVPREAPGIGWDLGESRGTVAVAHSKPSPHGLSPLRDKGPCSST